MDQAIRWWLQSSHNEWSQTNTYTRVTFYGNREQTPWQEPGGAGFIGNELRGCRYVGLGLSSPAPAPWECGQWHVVTAWGRDYSDVTPLRGVVMGGGSKQTLKVSVDVTRRQDADS